MIHCKTFLFTVLATFSVISISMNASIARQGFTTTQQVVDTGFPHAFDKFVELVPGKSGLYQFIEPKTAYNAAMIITDLWSKQDSASFNDRESYQTVIAYFIQKRDVCIDKEYPEASALAQQKANESGKSVALILVPRGYFFQYLQ